MVLCTATTFDYETNASTYTISVQAKDELNATTEGNFTVTLLDVYEPSRENNLIDLNYSVDLEMIWVEPGTFTMGSPESEANRSSDETQHLVTISEGFYLGKYEVTQGQYQAVTGINPSNWTGWGGQSGRANNMTNLALFINTLNQLQRDAGNLENGWKYVLPTEAEWEYACRAGSTTAYHWGNEILWGKARFGESTPTTVGSFAPNAWGFFDMHGNVSEWIGGPYYEYSNSGVTDPGGPNDGYNSHNRGGNFGSYPENIRSAYRREFTLSRPSWTLGFRLAYKKFPIRQST